MSTEMLETYRETIKHLSIEAKDGEIDTLDSAIEQGLAVRVIKDGRLGFAYSTKTGTSSKELAKIALDLSQDVAPDPDLEIPQQSAKYPAYSFDENTFASFTIDEKVAIALELEAGVKSFDKRITSVRKAAYEEEVHDVHISNSKGIDIKFSYGLCALRVTAIAEDGGLSEWATEVEFAKDPGALDIKSVAQGAAGRAVSYLGARSVSSRKTACILDRHVAAEILSHFGGVFFADAAYKKKSIFADKIGSRIYSPLISIIDDVTLKDCCRVPCDAEGVPSRRVAVIDGGVLTTFLSDSFYAKKTGARSTGSSVRQQITQAPKIGIRNLYILPGTTDRPGLIKEMGDGLLVNDVMGLHTANQVTGDFSIGAAGFLVKNGQIDYAVKGITIAGNVHELLRRVKGIGSDLKFWHESGAPSILLEEIAVSGD